jgi:hypothetical protein
MKRFPSDANASLGILPGGRTGTGFLDFRVNGESVRGVTSVEIVGGEVVVRLILQAVRFEAPQSVVTVHLGEQDAEELRRAVATMPPGRIERLDARPPTDRDGVGRVAFAV